MLRGPMNFRVWGPIHSRATGVCDSTNGISLGATRQLFERKMVGRPREAMAVVLAFVLLVSAVPVGSTLASGTTTGDTGPAPMTASFASGSGQSSGSALNLQTNNTTRQHDNPANVSRGGDLGAVRNWLSNRMLERLSDGAIQLDQGQYDRARSLLGDEFDSRLEQFVDVTGETDTDSDDDDSDPFEQTRERQRNLTDSVQEYEQTYDEYQDAVEANNETAAREYARELQRLSRDVRRQNRSVVTQYQRLENVTGADLTTAIDSIENVTTSVTERQAAVDDALFTQTVLAVDPETASISYTDPLAVSARLTTDSGEPVAERSIRVQIYDQVRTVRTDAEGRFQMTYRPRTIPVDRSQIRVLYRPADTSEYLAANDSVAVDIEQVTGTLSLTDPADEAAFGDRLEASATLTVDGQAVAGIPLSASLGSAELGSATSDQQGRASVVGSVPATVPAGDRSLTVSPSAPNAAVVADPVSEPVTVEMTATELTVEPDQQDSGTVVIDGTLATADGRPIPGQPVEVSVGETVTETVRTGPDGSYSLTLATTRLDVTEATTRTVRAAFDGTGTNLEPAEATTDATLRSPAVEGTPANADDSLPSRLVPDGADGSLFAIGGVASLVGLLLVLLVLRRRYTERAGTDASGDPTGDDSSTADSGASGADAAAAGVIGDSTAQGPDTTGPDFGPAESFLAAGDGAAAVTYLYQHLRSHVATEVDVAETDTHWEFFEAARRDGLDGERLDALRELVETYEAVEFRPGAANPGAEALLTRVTAQWD